MMMNRMAPPLAALAIAAMAALSAAPLAAAEDRPAGSWSFTLRAEGEVRYDDNVLSLSDREIDRFESDPAYRDSDRFRIDSVDDFIFAPDLGLVFRHGKKGGLDTSLGASLRSYQYQVDTVKNYQSYGVWLRQDLNHSRDHGTALSVRFTRTPSYYVRELTDDDESLAAGTIVRNSLDYDLNQGNLQIAQEIVARTLDLTVRYVLQRRNYNDHFNERDSSSRIWVANFDIFPLQRIIFRVKPYYARENRTSAGNIPASPVIDDDVGFDATFYGLELRWLWGPDSDHRQTVKVWYENETRDFTTDTPSDLGHYGREDDITQFWAGYEHELGREWMLRFAYRHRNNDSTTTGALGLTTSTAFTKDVMYASVVYRFDKPRGPEAATRAPRQPREPDQR